MAGFCSLGAAALGTACVLRFAAMIRHVVMWKMRGPSPSEKREQAEQVRQALLGLLGKVPGLTSLEVGVGAASDEQLADVVLMTSHESWQALEAYQKHPEHQVVARLIGELRTERRVVDFESSPSS
jgi:heme-degrading monooxygenase HmoA